MFNVIYEISEITPNYGPIIVAPVFWGFLIAIIRERYFLKDSEFSKATRLKYFTWLFTFLPLAIITTFGIFKNISKEKIINQLVSVNFNDKSNSSLKVETVEGYVENFVYAKDFSKGGESFTVNGKRFAYISSQYYGYNTYANNGGVIKPGKYLRIHFVYLDAFYGRIILKLEEDAERSK